MITLLTTTGNVKVYQTLFFGKRVCIYSYSNGEIYFGASDPETVGLYERSEQFECEMKFLNKLWIN